MFAPLLFTVAATFVDGQAPPPPPPAPVKIEVAAPVVAVKVPVHNGIVTTGPAEAVTAATPIDDPDGYALRMCLQLQAAQPWMGWTCP